MNSSHLQFWSLAVLLSRASYERCFVHVCERAWGVWLWRRDSQGTLFKYHFCLEWTIGTQSLHVETLTPKLIGILFHLCPYRDQCYTRGSVMYTYSATFPHLALQWIPPSQASRSDRCSLTTSRNRVTIWSLAPLWSPTMTRPCCLQMQAWTRYVWTWMQLWVTFHTD